jgi:hypothetical protein
MGKSKKLFLSDGEVAGWRGNTNHTPYLFKEHREGKKGEKILVPVRFSRSRAMNKATVEGPAQRLLDPIPVRSLHAYSPNKTAAKFRSGHRETTIFRAMIRSFFPLQRRSKQ